MGGDSPSCSITLVSRWSRSIRFLVSHEHKCLCDGLIWAWLGAAPRRNAAIYFGLEEEQRARGYAGEAASGGKATRWRHLSAQIGRCMCLRRACCIVEQSFEVDSSRGLSSVE